MFKKLLSILTPSDPKVRAAEIHRDVLRDAARMGGTLFGPVPNDVRREFFCLDEHTWIWHEEWTDASGTRHTRTTRYDVRPHGIFKAQDGMPYQPLSLEEAHRLCMAAFHYQQNMQAKYGPVPAAA